MCIGNVFWPTALKIVWNAVFLFLSRFSSCVPFSCRAIPISWSAIVCAVIIMRVGLFICRYDEAGDYSLGRRFRFAVVDLDKGKNYPLNFICMLPKNIIMNSKSQSVFIQIFGAKSLEQAMELLTGALETENDTEVKAEISRRLKLLEAKPSS